MTGARTILIGDVHGCSAELQDLLRCIELRQGDRIFCVGDLLCKGPDSLGVAEWAMANPNVRGVLGNHEARLLRYWNAGTLSEEKPYDRETYEQLGPRYEEVMRFFSRWPLFIEEPDFLLVHAGIDPFVPEAGRQSAEDLLTLRTLPATNRPWFEDYREERLVVFGHWPHPEPIIRANAVGLDTGCVYGGELSALVLPERRVVAVPARRAYRRKEGWKR